MTAEEPKVALTGRYSTKETSELLGIDQRTLRRWRDSGLIKFGVSRVNKRPFYSGAEIQRCWRACY